MIQSVPAFLAGWIVTAALLAIEHLLWRDTPRLVRYLLGGGTLCVGCTIAGALLDNVYLAVGPWFIGSAGLIVVLMTWYDGHAVTRMAAARRTGEIVGAARGLTQELGDARQSDHSGHGRQN